MAQLSTTERLKLHGLPGEGQKMHVAFQLEGQTRSSVGQTKPGFYRVDFLLARPNALKYTRDSISFIKNEVGDSHLRIAKHASERGPNDIEKLLLEGHYGGATIEFVCAVNDDGCIGRITAQQIWGKNHVDAELVAYRALTPFLSSWSTTLDIPIVVETIQVTDPSTYTESLRLHRPFRDMMPIGGVGPILTEEYSRFASVYREALNSNSPLYRFLCFYKLIESLHCRQKMLAFEAKASGGYPKKRQEDVKLSIETITGIITWVYPWEEMPINDLLLTQLLPSEAVGKKFRTIFNSVLEPIRNTIAHALMGSGEIKTVADRLEDVENISKWLPLLRLWSRVLLASDFPTEFNIIRPVIHINER